ncbi:MAG: hypothetical protein COV36_06075 [Alphaproteobacteria bacterium CG11_big_fil_rev_8_21_14_0_20_44_7]|nr:MAG: hypothetical protein COV36_06075 [Alphaproteobacteria bacterium CG11_big_fil_rev_8_21_14_0_20_44_7]
MTGTINRYDNQVKAPDEFEVWQKNVGTWVARENARATEFEKAGDYDGAALARASAKGLEHKWRDMQDAVGTRADTLRENVQNRPEKPTGGFSRAEREFLASR